jgi:hypothetical protein
MNTELTANQIKNILYFMPTFIDKNQLLDLDGECYSTVSDDTLSFILSDKDSWGRHYDSKLQINDPRVITAKIYPNGPDYPVDVVCNKRQLSTIKNNFSLFESAKTKFDTMFTIINVDAPELAKLYLDKFSQGVAYPDGITLELNPTPNQKQKVSGLRAKYFRINRDGVRLSYSLYFVLNRETDLKLALCKSSDTTSGIIFGTLPDLFTMLDRLRAEANMNAFSPEKKDMDKFKSRHDEDDIESEFGDDADEED